MKTAVVFGITGQDGSFLARLLLENGYRVVGAARRIQKEFTENLQYLGIAEQIDLIPASVTDSGEVAGIVQATRPSEIYNLAGQSSVARSFEEPARTFESIVTGTLNILEVVRRTGARIKLFNAGSGECFGDTKGRGLTEDTPFSPISPYGAAKTAASDLVKVYRNAYGVYACTGILMNHESQLRPAGFVTRKIVKTACEIARGECRELILGNITIERDWGWAHEYVRAMWMMLQQERADDFLIATGVTVSLEAFIAAVFGHLNLDWKEYVKIDPGLYRPADIQSVRANPEKALKQMGWKARYNALDVARMMVDAELGHHQASI